MRYTYATDLVSGAPHPQQQDNLPVTSSLPANDQNMVIWSLMEVVTAGGQAATNFNPAVPASYQVLLKAIINLIYPVNSIRHTYDTTNPGTYLPGTTWVAIGVGRMLVGRNAADTAFDTIGETGGAKTHTLTVGELPAHGHDMQFEGFSEAGGGTTNHQGFVVGDADLSLGTITNSTAVQNTGSGTPVNIMNPYEVVTIWRRTV